MVQDIELVPNGGCDVRIQGFVATRMVTSSGGRAPSTRVAR